MSENRTIIYISSIRWDYAWHRQQEMVSELEKCGYSIIFVQPCRKRKPFRSEVVNISENITLVTPCGLPYERCSSFVNWVNGKLMYKKLRTHTAKNNVFNPIVWYDRVHGVAIDQLCRISSCVVYDLIDEILAFGRYRNERLLLGLENKVLRNADLLISSSKVLLERKISQSGRKNINNLFVPNGVDTERFLKQDGKPHFLFEQLPPGPVIGFVGTISERSINYTLLEYAFTEHPEWQFIFVGPGRDEDKDRLRNGRNNVHIFDAVKGDEIPAVVAGFDVGLIPYNHSSDSMDYVFPRKAFEYLAAGKPVVSTKLAEIKDMEPYIMSADKPEKFVDLLERAIRDDTSSAEQRVEFASRFDWAKMIPEIKKLLR